MGKKKNREYSSDSGDSSDSEPIEKSKKHKSSKKSKKHKSKKKKRNNSSSNDSEDAWVEKNVDKKSPSPAPVAQKSQREDWMSADNFFIPTFTKEKPLTKSAVEKAGHAIYDPATSSRELNPYYKTGEGGLPSFQRPKDEDDYIDNRRTSARPAQSSSSGGWRKTRREERDRRERSPSRSHSRSRSPDERRRIMLPARPTERPSSPLEVKTAEVSTGVSASHSDFLTDEKMNEIGAKMIKAEIMGNTSLANKLKDKLERAKAFKSSGRLPPQSQQQEDVVLTITNAAGTTRPAKQREEPTKRPQDKRKKNKRVETHDMDGERTKYYPDDGKYDIKQMVNRFAFHILNRLLILICF